MFHSNPKPHKKQMNHFLRTTTIFMAIICGICTQTNAIGDDSSDERLINQFIQAKGSNLIVFDSTNIKQFWTDTSVLSRNKSIELLLQEKKTEKYEGIPLKIQLANVKEDMDCKIDVITECNDLSFSILDSKQKALSSFTQKEKFINNNIVSSSFHLEDIEDFSFYLKFASETLSELSIKKIILSFTSNPTTIFHSSPGMLKLTPEKITLRRAEIKPSDNDSFHVVGKLSVVLSKEFIYATGSPVRISAKLKNDGANDTDIRLGFAVYNKKHEWINNTFYPYNKSNKIVNVISAKQGDDKIVVDSLPEWRKGCYVALDAKEDMSDIPNNVFAGTISDVKEAENGQAEIYLNKPLEKEIKKGSSIRINSGGQGYISSTSKKLKPNEEETFTLEMSKDDSFFEYSSKAFSHGVYYVVPLIMSYSVDQNEENTILIESFTVSY